MDVSDWELVAAHLAGDQKAFGEIVRRYAPRLRPHLGRILRNVDPDDRRETIEDILQGAWMRLSRHAASGDPTRKFSTWIFTIATNLAFNELRNRKRSARLPMVRTGYNEESEFDSPDTAPQPDEACETKDMLAQLVEFLEDNTSHDNAEALHMFALEGLSYEEIALQLGVPLGTVKSRLARGREAARKFFKAQS